MRLTTDKPVWQLLREYELSEDSVHLRFGQWVYNRYGDGQPWPNLFYASSASRAIREIDADRQVRPFRVG